MKKQTTYLIGAACILIAVCIAGVLVLTSDRSEPPAKHSFRDIEISVPNPPALKDSDGIMTVSYLIVTSRFEADDIRLDKVEILDGMSGDVIMTLEKEGLASVYRPSSGDEGPEIGVTLTRQPSQIPERLVHRLTFTSQGRAVLPFSVTGGEVEIRGGLTILR